MLPKTAISISASDVRDILKETKMGKSAGLNSLAAKYFVYSHSSVTVHFIFNIYLYVKLWSAFMKTSIPRKQFGTDRNLLDLDSSVFKMLPWC